MSNFIKNIFSSSSSDAVKENPERKLINDALFASQIKMVSSRSSRKSSAFQKRAHDLDPTIEMQQPAFDRGFPEVPKTTQNQQSVISNDWNDPTIETEISPLRIDRTYLSV